MTNILKIGDINVSIMKNPISKFFLLIVGIAKLVNTTFAAPFLSIVSNDSFEDLDNGNPLYGLVLGNKS